MIMIPVYTMIMSKFLGAKNIKFRSEKSKTSNSHYFYFKIKCRNYVLRISDHDQNTLNYDFSILTEKDIGHVQHKIISFMNQQRQTL